MAWSELYGRIEAEELLTFDPRFSTETTPYRRDDQQENWGFIVSCSSTFQFWLSKPRY